MTNFEEFVCELEALASAALAGDQLESIDLESLLNGGVGQELRKRIPLQDRQAIGAFFTGAQLRSHALGAAIGQIFLSTVWDPACGAGDLLLSFAAKLPLENTLTATLISWGHKLYGTDTDATFIRATKARIVLCAFNRGVRNTAGSVIDLTTLFPQIVVADGLDQANSPTVSYIVLNPPYTMTEAPRDCSWGNGGVSSAALFVERCVKTAKDGTQIIAILPDVLRSGSRYDQWRKVISDNAEIKKIDIYGSFDPQADVDVFILELTKKTRIPDPSSRSMWASESVEKFQTIENICHVSVGPVVPHRHKLVGPTFAYLHAKDAMPWGEVTKLTERRPFSGRVTEPPFIVVRRTSSPHDKSRAIGTIITTDEPVAVENHLIILQPLDASLETCHKVLKSLKAEETKDWLNSRIRCRHLTVGAIRELPVFPSKED